MGIESGGALMEKRRGGGTSRSRGLLAGRLAVKIEICTDSSMRGGERLKRGPESVLGPPEDWRRTESATH